MGMLRYWDVQLFLKQGLLSTAEILNFQGIVQKSWGKCVLYTQRSLGFDMVQHKDHMPFLIDPCILSGLVIDGRLENPNVHAHRLFTQFCF